jgi:CrcB protein
VSVQKYLMIALGGALGAMARYQVTVAIQSRVVSLFPWGTFVVNVSGCFLMGAAAALVVGKTGLHENWAFFVPIGFIGAYTTFSTFELETYRAVTMSTFALGAANVAGSVIAGYAALWLGMVAAKLIA